MSINTANFPEGYAQRIKPRESFLAMYDQIGSLSPTLKLKHKFTLYNEGLEIIGGGRVVEKPSSPTDPFVGTRNRVQRRMSDAKQGECMLFTGAKEDSYYKIANSLNSYKGRKKASKVIILMNNQLSFGALMCKI